MAKILLTKGVEVNADIVNKILAIVDQGLIGNKGNKPGRFCVEQCIDYVANVERANIKGEKLEKGFVPDDEPDCVSESVRGFKIGLNDDGNWLNIGHRARGMRRLAIVQLGSVGIVKAKDFNAGLKVIKNRLIHQHNDAAIKTIRESVIKQLMKSNKSTELYDILTDAANDIDNEELEPPSNYESYTEYLDRCQLSAKDMAKALHDYAEEVVQLLVQLKSPGAKFLHLCPFKEYDHKGSKARA